MSTAIRKVRTLHAKIIDNEGSLEPIFSDQNLKNMHILRTIQDYIWTIQNNKEIPSFMKHAARMLLDEHIADADIYHTPDDTILGPCLHMIVGTFKEFHCYSAFNQTLSCMNDLGIITHDTERTFNIKKDPIAQRTSYKLFLHLQAKHGLFLPYTYPGHAAAEAISYELPAPERTKAIFDHILHILPPALRTNGLGVYATKNKYSFYRPISCMWIHAKKGIYLTQDGRTCEYSIIHEYMHHLDATCLLPAAAVRKLVRLVKEHTTRRILPSNDFRMKKIEALAGPMLALLSVPIRSFAFTPLSNIMTVLIILSFTNVFVRMLWHTNGIILAGDTLSDLPSEYAVTSQKEFIAELLTTIILYGDAYRVQPKDSLLYQLYHIATEEILEGITYTRDENMLVVQGPRTTDRPFRPRHEPSRWERLRRILD